MPGKLAKRLPGISWTVYSEEKQKKSGGIGMANWIRRLVVAFMLIFSIGFFVQVVEKDIAEDKKKIEWYKQEEQRAKKEQKNEEIVKADAQVSASVGEYDYRLGLMENQVVVYRGDESQIYEYTNLILQHLPYEEQRKILLGQGLYTEQELYEFLETYSS